MPVRQEPESWFAALRDDMSRLFDRFLADWEPGWLEALPGFRGAFAPRVDVSEDEKALRVHAELPGLEEKDIEVTLSNDVLTIQGEKKEEHEEKGRHFVRKETSVGSFRRDIPLPVEVQADKVEAEFKKGVLTITLPKTEAAQTRRKRIEVKASE
jgi:HSP20 family protein